jgi:hypothetical protein
MSQTGVIGKKSNVNDAVEKRLTENKDTKYRVKKARLREEITR